MIRSLWLGVGWLGIVAAFVFSLGPASTLPTAMQHADKLVHLASYGTLMFWWAQLYTTSRERVRLAIALVLLGILIGLSFYFAGRLFAHVGLLNDWPALLSAGAPVLITALVATALLVRAERR